MKFLLGICAVATALGSMGCAAPQRDQFQISMFTESDDGVSLAGVTVWHGDKMLGTSTDSGKLGVLVEAESGSKFEVRFDCPEGYVATRENVLVPLREASGLPATGGPEAPPTQASTADYSLTLECRPLQRDAMIVVRTNMANVPVKIGKKIIGVTNAEGVSHIALTMSPKEVFEIWLDSSANELLRPVNPVFPFAMPGHDELFVLQESFKIVEPERVAVVTKKKRRKKKRVKKEEKPSRPTQIGSGKNQWGTIK